MRESTQAKRAGHSYRKKRVRRKIHGTAARPRLAVFRSNRYISAQIIDDDGATTVAAAHDIKLETPSFEGLSGKVARAKAVGLALAEAAKAHGIEEVVFDRAGYKYHGRVAALADGAREGGLKF
jgi:large subunit ribosomal protein L18